MTAVYPLFLLLSSLFASSPFGERVRADTRGLYAAAARRVPLYGLETIRRDAASVPAAAAVRVSGWRGYNARLNGEWEPVPCATGTLALNGRPVFRFVAVSTARIFPESDARLFWALGAWRFGHVMWVLADCATAVALVESDAAHPAQIAPSAVWREHGGRVAGGDYGRSPGGDEAFHDVSGISVIAVGADSTVVT